MTRRPRTITSLDTTNPPSRTNPPTLAKFGRTAALSKGRYNDDDDLDYYDDDDDNDTDTNPRVTVAYSVI